MVDEEGRKEDKFELDATGESSGYISMAQARVLAMRTAREEPGNYGAAFEGMEMFFEVEGVGCKARPDLVSFSSEGVDVIDLKTTTDASVNGFRKTVANNKLFVQEWFYRKALEETGMKVNRFIFLCVEKTAPFAAAAYSINPSDVAEAESMVTDALKAYSKARETDVWKGYDVDVTEVTLPPWAMPDREPMPNGNWLSVKQAGQRFNVSRTTLYNWMNGEVESRRFGGRRFLSVKSMNKMVK